MRVIVNGLPRDFETGTTVAQLIMTVAGTTRGSAAVVDGEVVPRSTWDERQVVDGQAVELITAVQGG